MKKKPLARHPDAPPSEPDRTDGLRDLERRLGYRFKDRALLETALTHPSYRAEHPDCTADNQRLEFLGDAALALAAAHQLFRNCPNDQEGQLTEARSRLIRTVSLAGIARSLTLGPLLRLGRGEGLSGGADRDRNLEDALEAVIGAVFYEGGWTATLRVFKKIFPDTQPCNAATADTMNPKGALQEICQARGKTSPVYRLIGESGPDHAKQFTVEVLVEGKRLAQANGPSLRAAETEAARLALATLPPA